ncbi:MAG: hypothetical protein IJN25_07850 [Clostridia bacterium]|nr:hypothetical protein [Clostridia bacterium]
MKKLLIGAVSLILSLSLVACGNGGASEKTNVGATLEAFDTGATIERTVLYDENGIKITANELTYSSFSAELSVTMENNSEKDLTIMYGTSSCPNAVNGCMISDGYLHCEVTAGQTKTEEVSFSFISLNTYGITSIADIEVGFDISNDEMDSLYTGTVKIKTSASNTYDYSENRYQKIIKNGAFANEFDCKVNYFSENRLYEKYNICITSAAAITKSDGKPALLLEIDNGSSGRVFANIKEVYLNNHLVYESLWSSDGINANNKYVETILLSNLAEKYQGDFADIAEVSEISFTFTVGESWWEPADSEKITISLPKIVIPEKTE